MVHVVELWFQARFIHVLLESFFKKYLRRTIILCNNL